MERRPHSFVRRFFGSTIVLSACAMLGIFFIIGLIKSGIEEYHVRSEIRSLEAEKARWEHNKLELLSRLDDIKSDAFIEKQARLEFGLQKPGESVIILQRNTPSSMSDATSTLVQGAEVSRPALWWRYFFH